MPATVPASVQYNLMLQGKLPDPFLRANEAEVQWVEEKDWEFRRMIQLSDYVIEGERNVKLNLLFEGLDTYADIFLDGTLIAQANNYFRTWEVALPTDIDLAGMHELRVLFHAPVKQVKKEWKRLGYELPGGSKVMTRKPGFHYGWDWGPRIVTSGIWRPVSLVKWKETRLQDVFVEQLSLSKERAELMAHFTIEAHESARVRISVHHPEIEVNSLFIQLEEGSHTYKLPFSIKSPKLWWTWQLGTPHLYEIAFSITQHDIGLGSMIKRIGIREIKLMNQEEENGRNFYFMLNGVPVFMKGANYIPQDNFQARVKRSDYERLIRDAKAVGMNMLRVWGGGFYEEEVFYDLCDKEGILVWQDFMFACAMYPGGEEFLANVKAEAEENVIRLRNHPCMALWCGNNEISEGWHRWGWQSDRTEEEKAEIWGAYQDVFQGILPKAVKKHHPNIDYWESSPQFGRGNPRHQFEGDAHYWGVWHDAEPFEVFNEKVPRFMSEFGFQSFPSMNTVFEFAEPQDFFLDSEVMLAHQKHPRGNELIETYLKRDFPLPQSFDTFVYLSQIQQARGICMGIEAHRRNRPYCMGTLYWQLNDCWPVASWSGREYKGRWKALHYNLKRSFADILISPYVPPNDSAIEIHIVSDKLDTVEASLDIAVYDFIGNALSGSSTPVKIPPSSSQSYLNQFAPQYESVRQNTFMHISLVQGDSLLAEQFYYFAKPKDLQLPNHRLQPEVKPIEGGYEILLTNPVLAPFVYLALPKHSGHFSDNYFDLLPKSTKRVIFYTDEKIPNIEKELQVWHLGLVYRHAENMNYLFRKRR